MGLLDEAIREHLELKRMRGADSGEVVREEREALGAPARDADLLHDPAGPPDDEPPWDGHTPELEADAGHERPREPLASAERDWHAGAAADEPGAVSVAGERRTSWESPDDLFTDDLPTVEHRAADADDMREPADERRHEGSGVGSHHGADEPS